MTIAKGNGERLVQQGYIADPEVVAGSLSGVASTLSAGVGSLQSGRVMEHEGRRFVIEERQASFLAIELLDHLEAHRPVYQGRVVRVADDGA